MEKNRRSKIMTIVALCVAVVGLTLGFAAFSNTLTIQSSATVTPDKSDFKMVIYGVGDIDKFNSLDFSSTVTSSTISEPELSFNAKAINATIDNSTLTIKDLDVTLVKPSDSVTYYFKIVNEGKYDAYISNSDFQTIFNMSETKTCTASEGTTGTLVDEACKSIHIHAWGNDSGYNYYIDSNYIDNNTSNDYIKISPNDFMEFNISISYELSSVLADGDFIVNVDDIKLNFTTTEPTV